MRHLTLIGITFALLAIAAPATAETPRFNLVCESSHVATVDPIVAPGVMSAHEHEFFGNVSTDQDSTYDSMQGRSTSCEVSGDTAGYWTPTLFGPDGTAVRAESMNVYYRGLEATTTPFPADLRMISFKFRIGDRAGRLLVAFPSCWDGLHLDSPDHMSHMSFRRGGDCPASHPVDVPKITEVFRYPVDDLSGYYLASGPFSTGHADFWNTWDQDTLETLVADCLRGQQPICGRISDPAPAQPARSVVAGRRHS